MAAAVVVVVVVIVAVVVSYEMLFLQMLTSKLLEIILVF